jgi:hypothetical protein
MHLSYPVTDIYGSSWARQGFDGGEASAAYRLGKYYAAEADFSGAIGPTMNNGNTPNEYTTSTRTYMAGPRFFTNFHRVGVFGHVLFGGLTFTRGFPGDSGTSFAFALGGGVNLWATRHIGVRLVQFDYLRNTNSVAGEDADARSQPSTNYRVSTGIAVRF